MAQVLIFSLFAGCIRSAVAAAPCDPGSPWRFAGPRTYAQRGGNPNMTSAGAVQAIVQSKSPVSTWFAGSVNGGIWRTRNFEAEPTSAIRWVNVLDNQPVTCTSIGALHVSTTDPLTIFGGCGGSTSSMNGFGWNVLNSGEWGGVMVSRDQGDSWRMLESFPPNYFVTNIYARGDLILVATQSNLFDAQDGGVWRSTNAGKTWDRVLKQPTFTITATTQPHSLVLIATHARLPHGTVSVSTDLGGSWADFGSSSMDWGGVPFYTSAVVMADKSTLVVAGLTVSPDDAFKTDSAFFARSLSGDDDAQWTKLVQPTSMDQDAMPKDRMALLPDPDSSSLLYVAGNAGALAWRVTIAKQRRAPSSLPSSPSPAFSALWTEMWGEADTVDGSAPHSDCRNYAWDAQGHGRLVLVSDGGIFAREKPKSKGGRWVSLNGDIAEMEFLTAHLDSRSNQIVAGAQDNCAQVFRADGKSVALGIVEGDGTVTRVDGVHNPSRLFGTTQFMGIGAVDRDAAPSTLTDNQDDGDDIDGDDGDDNGDGDCGSLCMVQGDSYIGVPVSEYFKEPSSFPFFVQQYQLNSQMPTRFIFWTNGTKARPSAFYEMDIPAGVENSSMIGQPRLVARTEPDAMFLDFVVGGFTGGASDPSVLVGMSTTTLYVRSKGTRGKLVARPLPATFAMPITMPYNATTGARIVGPVSHGSTTSLAVSPADSNVVAVTGWPSVATNEGKEQVFYTTDGGQSWHNATDGLREATGVVGKVRPGGLLFVDLLENKDRALLVGTSTGVMVTFLGSNHTMRGSTGGRTSWERLGSFADFPLVLTAGLSYEHYSDTLVAATFGRGVYTLKNAKAALLRHRACSVGHSGTTIKPESSSACFFPPREE